MTSKPYCPRQKTSTIIARSWKSVPSSRRNWSVTWTLTLTTRPGRLNNWPIVIQIWPLAVATHQPNVAPSIASPLSFHIEIGMNICDTFSSICMRFFSGSSLSTKFLLSIKWVRTIPLIGLNYSMSALWRRWNCTIGSVLSFTMLI